MDNATKTRLMEATEAFHEQNDWQSVEALWQPYVAEGDLEAQFRLPYYYFFYAFDEKPEADARMLQLLRTAANQDHPDALYFLTHRCPEGEERNSLLLRAGELGSIDAQYDLGANYGAGWWMGPKDAAESARWYRRAAERGHPEAQYNLGFMYLLGEGVSSDRDEGLSWSAVRQPRGKPRR